MKMKSSPLLFALLFATTTCFASTNETSDKAVPRGFWSFIISLFTTPSPPINPTALKSTQTCIPDAVFTYDHNVCFCNKEGTRVTCKRKILSTLAPELHRIQLQNITTDCNPGEYFKKPCKECVCHTSGKYASCVFSQCSKNEATETRDKCTPGSVFNHRCNGCICGSNGTAACTSLACGLETWKENSTKCVPSSSLTMGCNECFCDKSGFKLNCEKMGCAPMSFYHENILNITMQCTPKATFDYNCHQCICEQNGKYAMCSGKQCPHKYDFVEVVDTAENCNPGMIFANKCNVCICDENRKGVCTTFSCNTSYDFLYVDHVDFARPEI